MPFIGTQPEVGGYSVLDALTASATASYTLQKDSANFTPSSANQLLVSLNGVIQKPGSSFTVSGSTLTFSSALDSSDSIDFIISMGEPLLVGTPSDGTVNTAKLATDAVTSAKIATNAVGSDALDLTVVNGPTFKAYKSAAQNSVTANTSTKVTFETELWDTASDYNVSNSRFTPSKAGYYIISCALQVAHAATNAAVLSILYKNGSALTQGNASSGMSGLYPSQRASWIMPMNGSSDYAEIYVYGQNNGGAFNFAYDQPYRNEFEAIWIRDL